MGYFTVRQQVASVNYL